MRRAMLLICCAAGCLAVPASARAAMAIEAPASGFTGETYVVSVAGTAPYAARLYWSVQQGSACDDDRWFTSKEVSGAFRVQFDARTDVPGPALLCTRLVDTAQSGGDVTLERAVVAMETRRANVTLALHPVHPVVGVDQAVRVRLVGFSESESTVWAWARPVDGAPCAELPWVGDTTYWQSTSGRVDRVESLGRIVVPGTYRICAKVINPHVSLDGYITIETHVIVSQACTDDRRSQTRRTASYRRARAAYRRARGARRARARRVMLRRHAAMDRARDRVRADC